MFLSPLGIYQGAQRSYRNNCFKRLSVGYMTEVDRRGEEQELTLLNQGGAACVNPGHGSALCKVWAGKLVLVLKKGQHSSRPRRHGQLLKSGLCV